jgi:hypothetical protein
MSQQDRAKRMRRPSQGFIRLILIFLVFISATTLLGQKSLSATKKLWAVHNNRSTYNTVILPLSLKKELSRLLLTDLRVPSPSIGPRLDGSSNKALGFLQVANYFETKPRTDRKGITTVRSISHPVFFPALSFRKRLYVFSETDPRSDTEIFNIFLKEADWKIDSGAKAAELVKLYFSATRLYFETRGKLILADIDDVPISYRNANADETKRLQRIVVSPKTKPVDASYEVELYTWEMVLGEVTKWNFKIHNHAQMDVQSEIVGKL